MKKALSLVAFVLVAFAIAAPACTAQVTDVYRDPNMDFGSIQKVAVVPFQNFARDQVVPERVRDVFVNRLLAADGVYVLPVGEVARGIGLRAARGLLGVLQAVPGEQLLVDQYLAQAAPRGPRAQRRV